jgi:SAM-dependent methyltransferase
VERENWDRRWEERSHHCHDDPVDVLVEELGRLEPGSALDLGCGAGRAAVWLADRGWKVTGVDFSEVALGLAREQRPDVEWVLADIREYEPRREAFDLVLVLYVHIPSPERRTLLARAAEAVAAGGTVLVLGHDVENIGTGAPGPSNPDVLYTPDGLGRELTGLDVVKAERRTRRVNGAEAVDSLVLARKLGS